MTGFWSALAVVFVAELGDKTQLVALGFGARHRLRLVLAGMAAAYLATSALSVGLGAAAGEALPDDVLRVVGGVLFLAFAVWTVLDRDEPGEATDRSNADGSDADGSETGRVADDARPSADRPVRVIGSVAAAMFVAELGDKTMLATATLASTRNPVAVFVGSLVGIFAAGTVGAVLGRTLGDRLPQRTVRVGSACLFAAFGVVLLVSAL